MSKFKVGDKVWFNDDVRIIKRVDEWENDEYGYYFNVYDELLNYKRECDLELYKSPHERLLELGFKLTDENEEFKYYTHQKALSNMITISKTTKNISADGKIDLELAQIIVDYLKELEDD